MSRFVEYFLVCAVVAFAIAFAKPVNKASRKAPTTEAPHDSQADLFAALSTSLNDNLSCDDWMDKKMAANGMTMEDLASAIVEPQHRDLALEFLLFCMMDDTPVANRQTVLQEEIRKASAMSKL